MRPVPQIALDFLKQAEACRLEAYLDQGGTWTIGWGHTGPEVVAGLTINLAQAEAYLAADAIKAALRLARKVIPSVIAALTDHQYAALISFVFNLGTGVPKKPTWRIFTLLNTGQLAAVPKEMMGFDHARVKGQMVELSGLMHRRAAEVTLWQTADLGAATAVLAAAPAEAPSSGYTRAVETPGTATPPKPLVKSRSWWTGLATAAGTGGVAITDKVHGAASFIHDKLAPFVAQSDTLQALDGNLILVLAALAIATPVFLALRNQEANR